jgi:hypothetical protein
MCSKFHNNENSLHEKHSSDASHLTVYLKESKYLELDLISTFTHKKFLAIRPRSPNG